MIAIIAILAALLLPSLQEARDTTKSAICKNNLRQCGLGVANYAGDNDGWWKYNGAHWMSNILLASTTTDFRRVTSEYFHRGIRNCPSSRFSDSQLYDGQGWAYGQYSQLTGYFPNWESTGSGENKLYCVKIFLFKDHNTAARRAGSVTNVPLFGDGDIHLYSFYCSSYF